MPSITRRRTPATGRRAEDDILAATRRLLTGGATFTELGIQQISDEAGVARSTFYSHFRDKTELLMRLAARMVEASFSIASAWEPAVGVDGLAADFLRVLGVWREHVGVLQAVTEVAAYEPTVREFWGQGLVQFVDRTIEVLRAEQDAGRSPADIDVVHASEIIVLGGERAMLHHVANSAPDTDAAFARELARTWWYGVYRRPATEN
ncbi:TetR/AcrR family transcriptional regulator [Kutzneria buriramensis]|uniref:AcrR family transcriptional regulator n=1 Tax=Kutzneria buriramensis TaxID=1045776 RepID=A0A3E0H3G3_9PSEU|nr:TetR/AcrR family transcriptional regulator [Kutzneria buriramensis]REH37058.1 AcrR family transcriptional regulator [Kutzneria buriramensis]